MAVQHARPDRHSHRDGHGFSHISPQEYERLLQKAVRVDPSRAKTPEHVGQRVTRAVKTKIEVPIEETVKVPVTRQVAHHSTQKKIVRGKEFVAVQKFQEVEETHIEVREEIVKGVRTVWKKVEEPYEKIVKKPISVTKTKMVPYTDYEEKEVEMVVEVPCDTIEEQEGFRYDKTIKMQPVEVEQDEVYELRPHLVGRGDVKIKASGNIVDMGCTAIGREEGFSSGQHHHHRHRHHRAEEDHHHHHRAEGGAERHSHRHHHARLEQEYKRYVDGAQTPRLQRPHSASGTRGALIQGIDRAALVRKLEENCRHGGAPVSARAHYAMRPGSATAGRSVHRRHERGGTEQRYERGGTCGGPACSGTKLLPGDPPHGAGMRESRGPRVAIHKA